MKKRILRLLMVLGVMLALCVSACAMQWAVGTGLISGSNGLLRPQSNASRAEVAAILARFAEYIG